MWLEYIRIARKVLWAHRFRSALTVSSVMFGAFSIVLMSSLAESGLTTLAKGIEDLGGARLIMVVGKQPERAEGKEASYHKGLTNADRNALFAALPHVVERSAYSSLWRKDAQGDTGVLTRTDVIGADGGFLGAFRMHVARGRAISEEDNVAHAKVCVVGPKLARKLWEDDALGRWLTVDGAKCQVVGQLADEERWGMNFGFDWLDVAVLPLTTLADVDPFALAGAEILFKTDDQRSNQAVKRIVNALLVARHNDVDDFEIFDFSRIMDKFDQIFAIMKVIVGFIAGIALLVGGVGVMNMMLVSVSERVREIGIRKALGASPRDVAAQFLLEAVVLSGTGGAIGVAGGIAGAVVAGAIFKHWKPMWVGVVSWPAVTTALVVSVAVGVVFGLFPARRAAALDAIAAMRR